jgi:hypothetical protein
MKRKLCLLIISFFRISLSAQDPWTTAPLEVTNSQTPKIGTSNSYGVQIVTYDSARFEIDNVGRTKVNRLAGPGYVTSPFLGQLVIIQSQI